MICIYNIQSTVAEKAVFLRIAVHFHPFNLLLYYYPIALCFYNLTISMKALSNTNTKGKRTADRSKACYDSCDNLVTAE